MATPDECISLCVICRKSYSNIIKGRALHDPLYLKYGLDVSLLTPGVVECRLSERLLSRNLPERSLLPFA